MLETIPGPPGYPVLGNILDVRDEVPINKLASIADKYGPIYKLKLRGNEVIVISNVQMLDELCNETRFCKVVAEGLARVKRPGPSGLFTAHQDDPDWGQAHRILMPAFGPLSISDMFDEMHDIATQLVLKWARKGPGYKLPVTDDFTRLTLDTIALCAMDYRSNSFYQDEMHPFVKAMSNTLTAGNGPSTMWDVLKALKGGKSSTLMDDQLLMQDIAGQLVKYRREHPSDKKDLLNAMVKGKDPRTGEGMRDDLIAANMITFLIAGHETTSGLLSFTFAQLLKNPAAYKAARSEVDRVVGKGKIKIEHMKDLKYINATLREALRLNPTVPAFVRQVRQKNKESIPSIGGYQLKRGQRVIALISKAQKDPDVYGEDANDFKPERMLNGNFEKLPKSAWKAFGTGMRSCIGRTFAWQEAVLATAMILQVFDLKLDDPSYEMHVKQTLTVKPRDFFMRATLREGMDATKLQDLMVSTHPGQPITNGISISREPHPPKDERSLDEMLILYGSNTGTCETLAQRLASDAETYGYHGVVMEMDSAINKLHSHQPVVIITASYEGQPPDNAAHFTNWLTSDQSLKFENMEYAVFGCGRSDWSATFQRIPKLVDRVFEEKHGKKIVPRGFADAARGDIFGNFDQWADQTFWPALAKRHGDKPATIDVVDRTPKLELNIFQGDRASRLRQDVRQAIVQETRSLVSASEPEKRHMEITLPSDMAYEPGDYLTVLPLNSEATIQRVMVRYHIPWDATITVKAKGATTLPTNTPLSVSDLLKGYLELSQPATKKDIRVLADSTQDEEAKRDLQSLADTSFDREILAKRMSVLDLLEQHPSIDLPFNIFLAMSHPCAFATTPSPHPPSSPPPAAQ